MTLAATEIEAEATSDGGQELEERRRVDEIAVHVVTGPRELDPRRRIGFPDPPRVGPLHGGHARMFSKTTNRRHKIGLQPTL